LFKPGILRHTLRGILRCGSWSAPDYWVCGIDWRIVPPFFLLLFAACSLLLPLKLKLFAQGILSSAARIILGAVRRVVRLAARRHRTLGEVWKTAIWVGARRGALENDLVILRCPPALRCMLLLNLVQGLQHVLVVYLILFG
jgi:hypothetical protein